MTDETTGISYQVKNPNGTTSWVITSKEGLALGENPLEADTEIMPWDVVLRFMAAGFRERRERRRRMVPRH